MLVSSVFPSRSNRGSTLAELRRLLARSSSWGEDVPANLPFGLAALDSHLPNDGLVCGALHEIVPANQVALPAAFGFAVAVLAHFTSSADACASRYSPAYPPPSSLHSDARKRDPAGWTKIIFVLPTYALRQYGRLSGHGLNSLGFAPRRAIVVETAHRHDILWAVTEALRSHAPQAVVAMIDRLDLKNSQKLHLAAVEAGLPLLLLRPLQTLESSAAATRWRIGPAPAARECFGCYARARWRLQLERCRNGRPGEWVVEYDHVAHRFSLVAALADLSLSRGTDDQLRRQANRS